MISEDELKKGPLTLSEISTSSIAVDIYSIHPRRWTNLVYDSLNFHVHRGVGHRRPDT